MLKVDLGCGPSKQSGFIGVDRFSLPGVDVVADLDEPLPFVSNSVDLLYASHSLEHVQDLMFTMREVYRICKHGAQVCIVAPYHEQKLNLANPYHICVFNEHTPRFWTDYPETPVDPDEFFHPHASGWGLSKSDHSDPGLDLRLARMEFFYFPEYRGFSPTQQRKLRQQRFDVCDQIMYHLIVWKPDNERSGASYSDYLAAFDPFEPNYVQDRKAKETEEFWGSYKNEIATSRPPRIDRESTSIEEVPCSTQFEPDNASDFLSSAIWLQDLRSENRHLRMQQEVMLEKTTLMREQLHSVRMALARTQVELAMKGEVLGEIRQENHELRSKYEAAEVIGAKLIPLKAELEVANGLLEWYRAAEARWKNEERALEAELIAAKQANVLRLLTSRVNSFKAALSRKNPLWDSVSPTFASLKSYTEQVTVKATNARLELSGDLRKVPYREYLIKGLTAPISSLSFAISPSVAASKGQVGIEIVSSARQIVVQTTIPLRSIDPNKPTIFALSRPISELGEHWELRIFVRDADVPVAVYEMVSYRLFGRVKRLPFALFK